MKKFLYMAVAAIAALSSCSSDDIVSNENGNGVSNANAPVFTATIEGEGATRTQLVEGSTAGKLTKVAWLNTDQVIIYGSGMSSTDKMFAKYAAAPTASDPTIATLTCQKMMKNNGTLFTYKAYYPASMVKISTLTDEEINNMGYNALGNQYCRFILPATQKYNGNNVVAPMYGCKEENGPIDPGPMEPGSASSSTDLSTYELKFYNTAAILAITVPYTEMTSVSSITLTADQNINGECEVNQDDKSLQIVRSYEDDAHNVVTLDCTDAEGQATAIPADGSKTFYIVIPVGGSSSPYTSFKFEVTDGTVTKTMTTKDGFSSSLARNKIYPINFADNQTPAADPNLLAGEFSVSATKKVKFTKGNLWCNTTTTPVTYGFETNQYDYPVVTDYTSDGTNDGTWLGTHVGHFYWTTTAASSYTNSYDYNINESTTDRFWCSEDNPLTVEGTSGLYALTYTEWKYLINTRTNLIKYGVNVINGNINHTNCLIIAPDGYTNSEKPLSTTTSYTLDELNSLGLVCLPATGNRNGTNINYCNDTGYYWSSTPDNSARGYAVYLDFNSLNVCAGNCYSRDLGRSIRLVQTVQAGEGGIDD